MPKKKCSVIFAKTKDRLFDKEEAINSDLKNLVMRYRVVLVCEIIRNGKKEYAFVMNDNPTKKRECDKVANVLYKHMGPLLGVKKGGAR